MLARAVAHRCPRHDIERGVTLHWHGYDVPNSQDGLPGVTQDSVLPGQEFVYRFRADQAGTSWYHTHSVSDVGVRMGLYGVLVVRPAPVSGVDVTVPVHTLAGLALPVPSVESVGPGCRCGCPAHNPGMWANHCHNLAHADAGMMLHLMYS